MYTKRPFLRDKISPEQLAKFRRGTDIGILARELFPGGKNMSPKSPSQFQKMREKTALALQDPETTVLYEAVFQFDEVLIMLDILVKENNQWHAYEVKSSRKISETYLIDAALQYYVINGCKIRLSSFTLIYINEEYLLQDSLNIHLLFKNKDVTQEVKALTGFIREQVQLSKKTVQLTSSPDIPIGLQCHNPYPCDFIGHCWKNIKPDSILFMRSVEEKQKFEWYYSGILSAENIPSDQLISQQSKLETIAFKNNKIVFDIKFKQKTAEKLRQSFNNTLFFKLIRIEAALPLIKNTKPYSPLPLALAYSSGPTQIIDLIIFEQSVEGIQKFINIMKRLTTNNSFLVTDDISTVNEILHGLEPTFQQVNTLCEILREKSAGLYQLIENCMVYHPIFRRPFNLASIAGFLSQSSFKLTHIQYIEKDILASASNGSNTEIGNKMNQYLKAIEAAYRFFV